MFVEMRNDEVGGLMCQAPRLTGGAAQDGNFILYHDKGTTARQVQYN